MTDNAVVTTAVVVLVARQNVMYARLVLIPAWRARRFFHGV
ncbi:hypothetical protein FOWG_15917 [Fusarium oxysporum f. sp. lycopersici MN25]|uniref:Uncharacterized protein n=1 Tax=Fusarium oxysporum Fo47 TaxID=660027 RepID=W9K102_FUSOX|nr:hypothetical protein FOZG_10408 [Fusarium oxysporum Fo47]EWZ80055.1 hypothetical protein FOWG_15917 [Fusarium oxysporum f. sp. lycopersici MN25]